MFKRIRREYLIGLTFFAVLIPVVIRLPYHRQSHLALASASAWRSYDNSLASVLALCLLVLCSAVVAFTGRRVLPDEAPASTQTIPPPLRSPSPALWRCLLVFAGVLLLYFPFALARYGPYIEDQYFLSILHRMQSGDRPYRDFGFLYGPLMVYLPYFWMRVWGFSMASYYSLYALIEAVQYTLLFILFHRYFSAFRTRWFSLLLTVAFLFDPLLGLNWHGLRRLLAVIVLVPLASQPASKKVLLVSSLVLGIYFSYSQEYAAAALLAALFMYGVLALRQPEMLRSHCVRAIVLAAGALAVWLVTTLSLLGGTFPAYLRNAGYVMRRFSAGERAFPFYWTLNSLAVFALLFLTAVLIGRGLGGTLKSKSLSAGDRVLLAGFVYALIVLKSSLNRADMWHLDGLLIVLVFAYIAPLPRVLFQAPPRIATALLSVIAVTYVIGLLPPASYYLSGLAKGMGDLLSRGARETRNGSGRAPSVIPERASNDDNVVRLARYLSQPAMANRPVVFYDDTWALDLQLGVYKTGYVQDGYLLSEQDGKDLVEILRTRPDALVVISRISYREIYGPPGEPRERPFDAYSKPSMTKTAIAWACSGHYRFIGDEVDHAMERWARTVGVWLRANYEPGADFDKLLLLERKGRFAKQTSD